MTQSGDEFLLFVETDVKLSVSKAPNFGAK
jgi:hypothetical protein